MVVIVVVKPAPIDGEIITVDLRQIRFPTLELHARCIPIAKSGHQIKYRIRHVSMCRVLYESYWFCTVKSPISQSYEAISTIASIFNRLDIVA
jgi:hypothetical protein